jgi:ferredoxin
MAKLVFKGKEIKVSDGSSLSIMSSHGVIFGCNSGMCGVCKCKVLKGMENLTPLTENEELHSLEKDERLLCQCKIKKGTVEIDEKI